MARSIKSVIRVGIGHVPGPGEPLKGPYNGPFETKAEAVDDANQAAVIDEKGPG